MSYAASFLRRGTTYDPECSRSSARLQIAGRILTDQGVSWTTEHGNTAVNERVEFGWVKHGCANNCITTIDQPWVTDQILEAAWHLADLIQTERGAYHRQEAWKAKERN